MATAPSGSCRPCPPRRPLAPAAPRRKRSGGRRRDRGTRAPPRRTASSRATTPGCARRWRPRSPPPLPPDRSAPPGPVGRTRGRRSPRAGAAERAPRGHPAGLPHRGSGCRCVRTCPRTRTRTPPSPALPLDAGREPSSGRRARAQLSTGRRRSRLTGRAAREPAQRCGDTPRDAPLGLRQRPLELLHLRVALEVIRVGLRERRVTLGLGLARPLLPAPGPGLDARVATLPLV